MSEQKEEIKPFPFFGYAPGNYMNDCAVCKKEMSRVDKLCFVCLECAIKASIAAQPPYNTGKGDGGLKQIIVDKNLTEEELEFFGDRLGNIFNCMEEYLQLSAPNTGKGGVWVKASERLPDTSGRYFVKMARQAIPNNGEKNQIATFTQHKEWYLENRHHSNDFFYVKPCEWLDEYQSPFASKRDENCKWVKQSEKPVDPHSEIVCSIGTDKYLGYVGADKMIWPLGMGDFRPFKSERIEFYFVITNPPKL